MRMGEKTQMRLRHERQSYGVAVHRKIWYNISIKSSERCQMKESQAMRNTMAIFCVSACCTLSGATREWLGGTGDATVRTNWSGETAPVAGDVVKFNQSADYTVTYPAGVNTAAYSQIWFDAARGHEFAVDGTDATLLAPTMESDVYKAEPFMFAMAGSKVFDLENYWGNQSKARGIYRMDDFKMHFVNIGDAQEMHFDKGTFNFYDPEGEATPVRHCFFTGGAGTSAYRTIVLHEGSSVKFGGACWFGNGLRDTLRCLGGTHSINGSIEFSWNNNTADGTDSHVEAFDDAVLSINGSTALGKDALKTRRFTFLAADGGTISFGGTIFNANGAGYHFFTATNGGVIAVGAKDVNISTAGSTATSVVEIVDGGVFRTASSNAASFCDLGRHFRMHGRDGVLDIAGSSYFNAGAEVALTGGVWRISKICTVRNKDAVFEANGTRLEWTYPLRQSAGTLRLLDVTGNAAAMMLGYAEYLNPSTSVVEIVGGAIEQTGTFIVGYATPASLRISGGRHVFHPNTSESVTGGHSYFEIGGGAYGELIVEGDGTEVDFAPITTGDGVYFGNNAGSSSSVRILGGSATFREHSYFVSRSSSTGAVEVAGGSLKFTDNVDVCRGTNTVNVSGGTLVVQGAYRMGAYTKNDGDGGLQTLNVRDGLADMRSIQLASTDWHDCRVNLTGGILVCTQLFGGSGAHANGNNGWARFHADGGVLKARTATENFMYGLDEAVIGADGLTIDADYDITISQAFMAADGVRGRLVKTGEGTLTLSSSLPDDVTLEVRGGKVVFAAGATCAGAAVVKGNAKIGFVASATVGSLTLGDAETGGALELEGGASLTVTGAFDAVHDGSADAWTLSVDSGTGATTIERDASPAQDLVIRVDSGTSNVAENVSYRKQDALKAIVASGATLNLQGAAGVGAFEKSGAGRARISNGANSFCSGVSLLGGLLSFDSISALGMDFAGTPALTQSSGTLEFAGGGETPAAWTVSAANATDAVVVKTDEDVKMTGVPNVVAGAIVKRGAGALEIAPSGRSKAVKLVSGNGKSVQSSTPPRSNRVAFDDFGTAPSDGYAGFNVAEGEVALRGNHAFNLNNSVMVGFRTQMPGAAKPTLVVDGASVTGGASGYLFCVGASCYPDDEPHEQSLIVTNGATLTVDTLCCGWFSYNPEQVIDVLIDDSTLHCTYCLWPNHSGYAGPKSVFTVRNGSRVYSAGQPPLFAGETELTFTDSILAKNSSLDCSGIRIENKASSKGLFRFGAGSHAYLDTITPIGAYGTLTLAFDGGTWHVSAADTALKIPYASTSSLGNVTVAFEEGGAAVPLDSGRTLTVTKRITGEGAFTKTGKGTMVFDTQSVWNSARTEETKVAGDPLTWGFAGEAQIEEGVVEVRSGAADASAKARIAAGATLSLVGEVEFGRIAGAGLVSGGTLSAATLVASLDESGANTNELVTLDCALSGVTKVDFGIPSGTPAPNPLPKDVEVANFTGADMGAWKAVNLGEPTLSAVFRLQGGKVLCDFKRSGMVIVVK